MLEATTGFKLSSDGRILNPDLHGNGVDNFIADLASDRLYGDLQGPVTPTYLPDLFAKYADAPPRASLNPATSTALWPIWPTHIDRSMWRAESVA